MKYSISGLMVLLLVQFARGNNSVEAGRSIKNNRIVVEIHFTPGYIKSLYPRYQFALTGDTILFRTSSVKECVEMKKVWAEHKLKVEKNSVRLTLMSDNLLTIESPFWRKGDKSFSPGDSVSITYREDGSTCLGNGREVFMLQEKLEQIFLKGRERWRAGWLDIKSFNDYLEYMKYCNDRLADAMQIMDACEEQIPYSIYRHIKIGCVYGVEFDRLQAFSWMIGKTSRDGSLNAGDWKAISDSTLEGAWGKWLRANGENMMEISYFYHYNRIQVYKRFGFDLKNENLNTEAKRRKLYYNSLKLNFKGQLRERLLQYFLTSEVMKDLGYNHPLTAILLSDYYKQPGFPQYKQWMKDFEKKASLLYSGNADKFAPDFQLINTRGDLFFSRELKGKLVLLDFWFSGCNGCLQMTPLLQKVEDTFSGDTGITFVSVSTDVDKARWLKSVDQKKYTTGNGLNLYTGGEGTNHPIIEDYNISSYPQLYLIDAQGQILFPVPDPRKDNGIELTNLIRKLRAEMYDGPYVLYKDDTTTIKFIHTDKVDSTNYYGPIVNRLDPIKIPVMTDEYPHMFDVSLKRDLLVEPVEYAKPEKLFVLSDIEGNFNALRKLLQTNGIIDDQFNWIFGDGHLILNGDIVDRGEQVMECLWLVYALEDKAKKAGGYVHYILGNHEILNMSGDLRYVQEKYKTSARLLQRPYKELLGESSELGRWLRTKNVIERIGNILFTHGGISREVNNMSLTLQQINDLIRPHYASRDEFKQNQKTPELRLLFNSAISPFWYRAYYKESGQEQIIDSSLRKFSVNHIITGHTIVADSISVHYDGKIINTDVRHAKGKSEALLIKGNKYYRVNADGKKMPFDISTGSSSAALIQYPKFN